ncbi:hypothetical protein LOAG_16689 [Loa loa]|uniref:BED-type domain-containing protein n=1 Tax=Loa loa TaxID=7209 RepID=A0A1I7VUE7_LOALO|nr:hypothetical protein LOAG_16689 [Loa loa]EJD76341.1 hypothetical protein LOAG_16689 [Loa loa]
MLESRNESFSTSVNVLRPEDCVNAKKNNGGHHGIDSSVADCKKSLLSAKISSLPTSCPTMIMDEEKEVDSGNNMLSSSNIGEYSVEMLARLTSSTVNILENQYSDNVKNGATKKRKSQKFKPSSVWKHFFRLSDGNVRCVHCAKVLKRKDSSTKTMWGHLRAIHFKGRDWTVLQQQAVRDHSRPQVNRIEMASLDELDPSGIITTQNWLEQRVGILCDKSQEAQSATGQLDDSSADSFPLMPTQPYIKRNRSLLVSNGRSTNSKNIDHNSINDCTYDGDSLNAALPTFAQSDRSTEEKALNFLSSIPHTSEIINITAGYTGSTDHRCSALCGKLENSNGGYNSADISAAALNASNCLLSSVHNRLIAANQSASSVSSTLPHLLDSFSIFDPESLAVFMRAATDLDCTLSFHCRDNQPRLSFESNLTAASRLKGVEICMTEMDDEVHIIVHTDGTELDRESWKKTDKAQLMWAVRGKCQKVLTQ